MLATLAATRRQHESSQTNKLNSSYVSSERGVCAMFAEIYTSLAECEGGRGGGSCDALHFKHLFLYIQVTVRQRKERERERESAARSLFNFATFCISQGNFHVDYISFVPHNAPLRFYTGGGQGGGKIQLSLKFGACLSSKSGKDD